MKISTSPDLAVKIAEVSYYQSCQMMKEAGFDGVDFSLCRDQTDPVKQMSDAWMEDALERASAVKAAGLEIAQCHLPYIGNHIQRPGDGGWRDFIDFTLPGLLRSLDVCAETGCPVAVIHPYFDPLSKDATREGNLRLIDKMIGVLEGCRIRLAIENIYGANYSDSGMSTAENIGALIAEVDSAYVGACIDTGHANILSQNIADMARAYGKKLFALHVNGNAGKDEHVIPYTMSDWCEKMDYHAFTQALKDIGFEGYYNLEIACGKLPARAAQPFLNYAAAVAKGLSES